MPLHVQLSVYWFFMAGAFGVFFPYFTLYLKDSVGLSGSEVGMVFAIPPLVGMLAPGFWGQVADRTGARARTLAVLAIGASVGYVGITLPERFATVALATVGLAIFSSALMPMAVAVSLAGLRGDAPAFGRVRVWGTIGFLCSVVATPPLLRWSRHAFDWNAGFTEAVADAEPGLYGIFYLASALTVIASVTAITLPRTDALAVRAERGAYRLLVRHRPYRRLLVFAFGSYLFLQGPMILFPVYVRERGGDMSTLSYTWIWMIALEVPLVANAGRIFARVGARRLVTIGTAAGGLRWLCCALTNDLSFIFPIQLLHAITVTGLIVGGALYAEQLAPERLRSTAQAGLVTFGYSIGGILSSTIGGRVLDAWGIDAVYTIGGLGGLAVAAAGRWVLPDTAKASKPEADQSPSSVR